MPALACSEAVLEAFVSMMNFGGGLQWKESGTDGLVLSTEIHQEISWRNVGDVCAPLRLVERRIAWAMCGRPHNTTRVSHSSARQRLPLLLGGEQACLPEHKVRDRCSELGWWDERNHAHGVDGGPNEGQAGRGPSTLAIGTPSMCVTA